MSFHNKPNYQIPELIEALKAHRLPHDTPSQLADSFRIGWMACRERAPADSVQEDAARWNAWASGMVEACNSDEQEPAFLVALDKAIGDAEPPITLELLNEWTDAARKQGGAA